MRSSVTAIQLNPSAVRAVAVLGQISGRPLIEISLNKRIKAGTRPEGPLYRQSGLPKDGTWTCSALSIESTLPPWAQIEPGLSDIPGLSFKMDWRLGDAKVFETTGEDGRKLIEIGIHLAKSFELDPNLRSESNGPFVLNPDRYAAMFDHPALSMIWNGSKAPAISALAWSLHYGCSALTGRRPEDGFDGILAPLVPRGYARGISGNIGTTFQPINDQEPVIDLQRFDCTFGFPLMENNAGNNLTALQMIVRPK